METLINTYGLIYLITGITIFIIMSIVLTTARLYSGQNPPLDVILTTRGFWIGIGVAILSGLLSPIFILAVTIIALSKLTLGSIFVIRVIQNLTQSLSKKKVPLKEEETPKLKTTTPTPAPAPKIVEKPAPPVEKFEVNKYRLDVKLPPPPPSAIEDIVPEPSEVVIKDGKLSVRGDLDNKL
jgi:hypothetical protein